MNLPGRTFIARHGETVFNKAQRMQGALLHTPLTRAGFAQAEAMGQQLAQVIDPAAPLELWASPTGRALQTLAIVAEHLGRDWHAARQDARLAEIGMGGWDGLPYAEIAAREGPIFDVERDVFIRTAPDGESYAQVAARLADWIAAQTEPRDRLVIMHGASSSVLRGLLVGGSAHPVCGTLTAPRLPQGSVVRIEDGRETVVVTGTGTH